MGGNAIGSDESALDGTSIVGGGKLGDAPFAPSFEIALFALFAIALPFMLGT